MTSGRRARLAALALAAGWMGAAAGLGCSREVPVATALEATGTVARGHGRAWSGVVPGTAFIVGDTLRTGARSGTRLALAGGGVIRVGENAGLRFQRGATPGQRPPDIAVELGTAEVEETTTEVSILTAMGAARIERGAHVRVRADGQTSSLEVVVGRAVMLEGGKEVAVDAGQGVRIRLGSAEVERFALKVGDAIVERQPAGAAVAGGEGPPAAATAPASSQDAAVAPTAIDAGGTASHGSRTDTARADITIAAGESATLHDARPPAAVRLRLEAVCPGEAIVELGGHGHHRERVAGARAVVLRLGLGTRPYRVRCANDGNAAEPRASGVLSLRRDTGNVPLARRAPANVIDADGRRYTVMFQTRLPQLTLAWPKSPAGATKLELHLESAAGERIVPGASPSRPLPSGTVQEGTYTFWYQARDGKESPKTTISVRFDNAAPTVQFFRTSSAAGQGARGAIAVDGVTVEGAKVSVGGQPLEVDGRGRFRVDAKPLEGDDAVAVRLEHPRTGIHYYVRRRSETR